MRTSRLEAFSDGVLAIVITVMVLELKAPGGRTLHALLHDTGSGLLTYLLSFVYIGIYWNNHHHLFHVVERIRGGVLWANLHLLLWLSLYPFTTSWMDSTHFARTPVIVYGANLMGAAIAYYVLQTVVVRAEGEQSALRRAIGTDVKGKVSPLIYAAGITAASFITSTGDVPTYLAMGCFVVVAIMWLVPDRRLERYVLDHDQPAAAA